MIKRRGDKYVVDTKWPDGMRTRFRRPSKDQAEELDLRIRLAILDGTHEALRAGLYQREAPVIHGLFRDVADEYYETWVRVHNRSTDCKRSFLARFKRRFGHVPVRAFRMQHVDRYVAWRRRNVINATINRELSCLRHLFDWSIDRGLVDVNPLGRLKSLQEQEWAGPKPTTEAVEAVLARLTPDIRPLFVFIRETGCRSGEAFNLERWQIDRGNQVVVFSRKTKNGKSTVAPLTDRAIAAIDAMPELAGCPYVFFNPETRTRWYDLRRVWKTARVAAKVPWLRIRDLRPAFGIEAAESGVPMHFIQSVLGHGSVAVTERYYAKFSPEAAAGEVRRRLAEARLKRVSVARTVAQGEGS